MYIDHTHRENQKVVTKIIELLPGTLNFSNLTMKFREEGVLIMYMGVDKCTQVALDLLSHWRIWHLRRDILYGSYMEVSV